MKIGPMMILFSAVAYFSDNPLQASQLLYLASTQEKTIVAYAVDIESGALSKKFSLDLPGNAGPLAFSPDSSFIYAAQTGLEGGRAGVSTLKRADDGSLAAYFPDGIVS